MTTSPLRVLGRRAAVACAALVGLVGLMATTGTASAASIAYLDGREVWVSTLDGSRKERLSAGEGDWIAVTAADNGRILGVRLEAGKIFQLATTQLWDANGSVLSQGPLPSTAGWNSYVAPLGLDLTSDGVFAVYGYAGQVGFVPNATFPRGHYAILSDTKTNLTPIGQSGYLYPTTVGRRVVAAQGSQVVVQAAESSNPFAITWTPIIDTSGTGLSLRRTDVAATGRMVAAELTADPGDDRIAALSISGIDAPVTVGATADCFLPTVGEATDPTFSQDGTRIAWKDAQGVKIAGAPSGNAEPCALASAPIVISPTGSSPSIGGADLAQLKPAAAPAPGAPGTTPTPAAPLGLTLPAKPTAAALIGARGLPLKVRTPRAGKVTATGSVAAKRLGLKGTRQIVIATGAISTKAAGTVTLRLRLKKTALKYRARLRGATLVVRITQGGKTTRKSIRLR